MRVRGAALLLAVLFALAGCTKGGTTTTSTTTTTSSTSTTTTSSTTTTTTTTPGTTTTTPPPVENNSTSPPVTRYANVTHEFSDPDANLTLTLDANATWTNVTVFIHASQTLLGTYACAGSLHVAIYAPNGTLWNDYLGGQNPNADSNRTGCGTISASGERGPIVPGVWHVQFTGPGTGTALVSART